MIRGRDKKPRGTEGQAHTHEEIGRDRHKEILETRETKEMRETEMMNR